jgi:uncharacterized protein (UPF0254 family)
MSTPEFPKFAADPNWYADAVREASIQGIDALLGLQKELNTATLKGLQQIRTESDRVADLQVKAIEDTLAANVDIAEKAMGWYREQIERLGKAPEA